MVAPEPEHAWTQGRGASLFFRTGPPVRDVVLALQLVPFIGLPSLPSQRLRLLINGMAVAESSLSGATTLRVTVPGDILTTEEGLQ